MDVLIIDINDLFCIFKEVLLDINVNLLMLLIEKGWFMINIFFYDLLLIINYFY